MVDSIALDLDGAIDISSLSSDRAIELYRRMRLIREFEGNVNRLFLQGRIPGTIHLSHGQEACAVGGCASLRADDRITLTHRGHGQALAKGVPARTLMAELFARETGCCRGMGGSLHVGDWSVGALPAIGIVGASIPIAAGIAFAARYSGDDRVTVCFTGDGATTEGDAHEGYNLATLWQLPVVYVCENNLYSISTRVERQARITSVAERVRAYGMPAVVVDGNDVVAVTHAVADAVGRVRTGNGPELDKVDAWLRRDPVVRMRAALDRHGLSREADEADTAVAEELAEAIEFAEASPLATGVIPA